jgi:hypothetical protein
MGLKASISRTGRFRWVILAFIFYGMVNAGLLIWQLSETSPFRWCSAADVNDVSASGCFTLLLKLLEIKDHTILGLLGIMGLTALAVVIVTLKVRMDIEGPGGLKAKIDENQTTIEDSEGTSSVTIPTPPSE